MTEARSFLAKDAAAFVRVTLAGARRSVARSNVVREWHLARDGAVGAPHATIRDPRWRG